ncbi:MAG TPA: hypothetical protein VMT68_15310 [Caulobacteraceae bacterium]|nr:hypothetical protein [Caulobacteraceae bacterium]
MYLALFAIVAIAVVVGAAWLPRSVASDAARRLMRAGGSPTHPLGATPARDL